MKANSLLHCISKISVMRRSLYLINSIIIVYIYSLIIIYICKTNSYKKRITILFHYY